MSKSTHQIEVRGRDATGAAFSSIKNRAAVTGAQIRSMVGGALAAAGAYMSFRAITGGIDELGHLSDIAQKTGTSVDELTKAVTAFNVVGIQNMGVDQLGKAFDYMAKTTGRSGMEGFYQTIGEIGKIPDVAKRGQEAMRIFGRSGMEFMPLIKGAENGTSAIRSVIETLPGVSQAAANVGDELSDAKNIGATGFKSIWLNAIGAVCSRFGIDFRGAAAAMVAYVDYGVHVAWRYLQSLFDANDQGVKRFETAWKTIGNSILRSVVIISATCFEYIKTIPNLIIAGFADGIMGIPAIFSSSYRERHNQIMNDWMAEISQNMWQAIDKDLKALGIDVVRDSLGKDLQTVFSDVKTDDLDKKLESMLEKAGKLRKNIDSSVGAGNGGGKVNNSNGIGVDIGRSKPSIRNDLIFAGSNAALRAQILGPTLQSEAKKQTALLEKIADSSEKTADAVEEREHWQDEMKVVN